MREGNSFPLVFVCFQVVLAERSKVLCKCSGDLLDYAFLLPVPHMPFINHILDPSFQLYSISKVNIR